jgi:hypothetical protein
LDRKGSQKCFRNFCGPFYLGSKAIPTLAKGDIRWVYKRSRETMEWDFKPDKQFRESGKKNGKEII